MAEHWAFGHATLHFNRTTRRMEGRNFCRAVMDCVKRVH
jgi:hypothetical protein